MLRPILPALALVAGLAFAPLQCQSEPDPAKAREETPAEALYGLANDFHAKGDERARGETLRYLLQRYPTSRFAVMAREDLERMGPGASGVGAASSAP